MLRLPQWLFLVVPVVAQLLKEEDSEGVPGSGPEECISGDGSTASTACAAPTRQLAAVLRGAASQEELQRWEGLRAEAETSTNRGLVRQRRNFGESAYAGGHEVTYLHRHASEAALDGLWVLAQAALAALPAGSAVQQALQKNVGEGRPTLRCLEAISYFNEGDGDDARTPAAEPSDPSVLAWHHDGATLLTVAVALASAGRDYQGGELELRGPGGRRQLVADMQRGDVVAWRGWDEHRVRPVSSGRREVIVAEWWLGRPPSGEVFRPVDKEDDFNEVLLHIDPEAATLHHGLATALLERGDAALAARSLREALRRDPERADSHIGLGVLHRRRNDLAAAQESFLAALKAKPHHVYATFMLGETRERKGDFSAAERSYRKVLRLDPGNIDAMAGLGTALSAQSSFTAAEQQFRAAIAIKPAHAKAQTGLGMALGRRGEHSDAQNCFKAALQELPTYVGAHIGLGTVRIQAGDLADAAESFRAALSIEPQNPAGRALLNRALGAMAKRNAATAGA
mmetsp:Transcript_108217/g.316507  ORF Transcript_108217/g.316507 Transcript_108217/m.316507 type:complete len:514 (-) Transcript_108217:57-1598(-)